MKGADPVFKGLYIDDDEPQRVLYSELLSSDKFDFSEEALPKSLSYLVDTIEEQEPSIIVMDYRLDGTHNDGWDNKFKAGGVAQVLRDHFVEAPARDVPIILLSTERNIQQLFAPDKTSHDLFDLWYLKEELHLGEGSRRNEIHSKLEALVCGYQQIKDELAVGEPQGLAQRLLALSKEEYAQINSEGLKLLLLNSEGAGERPHVIARQFYHSVIKQPGLLISRRSLAAKLGITPESFAELANAGIFSNLEFDGLFAGGWHRFWRHRFDQWEDETFDILLANLTGQERADKLADRFKRPVEAAASKWSGSSNEKFSFACRVCEDATELCHSVAAFEPKLLPFMERGRICYDCIDREDEMRRKRIRVAEADEQIVSDIRNEIIVRPVVEG
ncbi:hypothetical protein BA950_09275 [Erythrobacter sp. SAORIC-644]|uniref:response regulator n=1 Tax=Erythrobacter sp. SAORIC-644 TaxID=1869314 RepID=UPI000C9F1243|nr:response regulator [Erythrobacter sp. SAORIC-644]PNQ76002.1 hypothetical protein BA950_09275 [Erythrobacter sp. SAORIC-644]